MPKIPEKNTYFFHYVLLYILLTGFYNINFIGFHNTLTCNSHPTGLYLGQQFVMNVCVLSHPLFGKQTFCKNNIRKHWGEFVYFYTVCVVFSHARIDFQKNVEVKHTIYFEWPYPFCRKCSQMMAIALLPLTVISIIVAVFKHTRCMGKSIV